MKTSLLIRMLCLLLSLTMVISLMGCKGSKKPAASSSDTADISSVEEESESEESQPEEESEESYFEESYYEESVEELPEETSSYEEESYEEESGEPTFEDLYPDAAYANEIMIYNTEEPIQKNFLGMNGIYQCFPFMEITEDRTYTQKQIDTELSRVTQMGVKMVRTFYSTRYAYDQASGSFNWESDNMNAIYKWMHVMQDNNIDIALNAGWEMSIFYEDDPNASGIWDYFHGVFVEGDPEKSAENYANWMTESLNKFRSKGINNIKYLMMFTEPGGFNSVRTEKQYKNKSVYEIEDPKFDTWLNLVKALDSSLKKEGIRDDYMIVGPNEAHTFFSEVDGTYFLPMFYNALTQANDYIDIFSHHNYLTILDLTDEAAPSQVELYWAERARLTKEVTGKSFWIDETNIRNQATDTPGGGCNDSVWHAMQMALVMSSNMNYGIQNTIIWSLASQQWNSNNTNNDGYYNGVQNTGLFPSVYLSDVPYVSYYGTSLLTKYFGHGGTVYPIDEGWMYAACEESRDGEWTVLVTNMGFEETDFKVAFDAGIGDKTFYRYMYYTNGQVATSAAKPIGADRGIKSDDGLFYDTLPGGSFAVYTTVKPE